MAVFVDDLKHYQHPPDGFRSHSPEAGRYWCHLFADTLEELHAFAEEIGLQREWFQDRRYPHYDLTERRRRDAVWAGAQRITTRDWIRRCRSKEERN